MSFCFLANKSAGKHFLQKNLMMLADVSCSDACRPMTVGDATELNYVDKGISLESFKFIFKKTFLNCSGSLSDVFYCDVYF